MQKVKILIASDSYIVSKGLHLILSEMRSVQLHHYNLEDEGSFLNNLNKLKPHVLLISSQMVSQLNLKTNQILNTHADTKVLGLEYPNQEFKQNFQCHKIFKLTDSKEFISENLIALMDQLLQNEESEPENSELSQREKMILKHVAMGQANKEIADKLFISMHTVITHRKKITRKLGIKTISGLTVYAIIHGLLGMEDIEN